MSIVRRASGDRSPNWRKVVAIISSAMPHPGSPGSRPSNAGCARKLTCCGTRVVHLADLVIATRLGCWVRCSWAEDATGDEDRRDYGRSAFDHGRNDRTKKESPPLEIERGAKLNESVKKGPRADSRLRAAVPHAARRMVRSPPPISPSPFRSRWHHGGAPSSKEDGEVTTTD